MIVSAAVIDDMIALVVLSMLEVLEGEITVSRIIIPIISALAFLFGGGYVCIFILPGLIKKHILSRFEEDRHDRIELALMFSLLFALIPATRYARASYLMGSFLSGLTFCSSDGLHHIFVRQFKRVLQWLVRIFFSASIGFQVPIQDFGDITVIWKGVVLCLVLIGKVSVGFMVPNFSQARRFTGLHLKDCLITGFSMASEGEFAFVIAVYVVDAALIDKRLYASIVLAVLISTIIPPFFLRFTISYYNRKGEEAVARAAEEEKLRNHSLDTIADLTLPQGDENLIDSIRNQTDIFLVIQTRCESKWGILMKMMDIMTQKHLDVIDHRSWCPRGINTTLVSEVYARSKLTVKSGETSQMGLDGLIEDIANTLEDAINQPDAKVKIQRWFPGVVEEIVEDVVHMDHKDIRHRLLTEASQILEKKQKLQTDATKEKSVEEIMGEAAEEAQRQVNAVGATPESAGPSDFGIEPSTKSESRRRVRQKTRSTPVVGGGLFGEGIEARSGRESPGKFSVPSRSKNADLIPLTAGVPAEIFVNGQSFNIRISQVTLQDLKSGFTKNSRRGHPISAVQITMHEDAPVTQMLQGFVRHPPLDQIQEGGEEQMSFTDVSDNFGHSEKDV
jgi:Sodium/hydrogen exchanger family